MSHTWLASHTGAIDLCACSRIRSPCFPPPAVSCQKPAPKSAPPSTPYSARPIKANTSGNA